jgi:hypothetical protein
MTFPTTELAPRALRLAALLVVVAAGASAQSSGHFELDVRKSGVLSPGKSHIDPVSAWVTHTDEFFHGRTMALKIQMFTSPIDAAARQRLVKNDDDHHDLSRSGLGAFVLFLDGQNRIRQVNLTYVIPGTTVVRSIATTTDEVAKWFGDYRFADGRLHLKSKGTYATGTESPDEVLSLAWDISVDAPVVEHHRP